MDAEDADEGCSDDKHNTDLWLRSAKNSGDHTAADIDY